MKQMCELSYAVGWCRWQRRFPCTMPVFAPPASKAADHIRPGANLPAPFFSTYILGDPIWNLRTSQGMIRVSGAKSHNRKQQGNFLGKSGQIFSFLAGPGTGPGSLRDMDAVALGSGFYSYSQRKRHGLATRATSPRTFCHHPVCVSEWPGLCLFLASIPFVSAGWHKLAGSARIRLPLTCVQS